MRGRAWGREGTERALGVAQGGTGRQAGGERVEIEVVGLHVCSRELEGSSPLCEVGGEVIHQEGKTRG